MVKKISIVSLVIVLVFMFSSVTMLDAANNDGITNTISTDTHISSTTITWGGSLLDWGASVGIDSEENVVMVGYSETAVGYNLTVVKYDSYFNYLWNSTLEINELDEPRDVVIDDSDNIYVTGSIWLGATKNVIIVKFDSTGNLLWNQTWQTVTFDDAYGLDLDSSNNIYVTGTTTGSLGSTFILKYDTDGVYQWNNSYGAIDDTVAYDIKINNTDIFLTGSIESPSMTGLFLSKFNSTGHNNWTKTLGGLGTEDIGTGLLVDGEDIYVVGQTESLANILIDTILIKYNSTGDIQWYRLRDEEEGNSITLRPDGNIVIAGNIGSTNGVFLVEYSTSGLTRWNTTWAIDGTDNCAAIIAGVNNIYLTGRSNSYGSGDYDMLLVTFQPVIYITLPPETITIPGDNPDVNITIKILGRVLVWVGLVLLIIILVILVVFFIIYLCDTRGTRTRARTKTQKPKTIIKEVPVTKTVIQEKIITKEGPPGPEKRPEDEPLTMESEIDDSPEVGPATERQFKKSKFKKVKNFLAKTPEEVVELLNKNGYTRLKVDDIKRMQTEAQLMIDIPPLRVHDAVILFQVGIKSRTALAKSDQDELWENVQDVLGDHHVKKFLRWSNLEPTYEEIGEWIEAGKQALK